MKNLLLQIWRSSLVRDAGKLLSANILAQALGIIIYPVLSRMYGAEDFGLCSLFLSIGGVLVLLSTADYHNAIVLPKEETHARGVVALCAIVTACVAGALVLSIPFSRPIARLFNAPGLADWWWVMPVYVGGLGAWVILNNYYIRAKSFQRVSVYQLSQSVLSAGGKLGLGAAGWLSGGMILSASFAPVLAIVVSLYNGGRKMLATLRQVDGKTIKAMAYEYRKFPLYSLPRSLVSSLNSNLPALLLAPVFGLTELGYFGMALTLSLRPLQMVTQSLYQVLLQRTAQRVNERKRISGLLLRFVMMAFAVLVPVFAGLYFILPALTEVLLGESWRICGEYIRLLLPWLLIMTAVAPIGFITDIFGQQRIAFIVEIAYLGLSVIALGVGMYLHDFQTTLLCLSLVKAVVIAGQMGWYAVLIRRYDRSVATSD